MLSRRTILGSLAVVVTGLATGVAAFAAGGHGGRPAMMRHFVTRMIDEALDQANATVEQRTAIYGARDRAFAAIE